MITLGRASRVRTLAILELEPARAGKTISIDFFVPPGDHQMQIRGAGSQF
ncbi:MAG: hypothetical protein WA667_15255 [Candidatus Nitrosopolaris sp.]